MQLNSFTSNKLTLHQPFLGRGGYSQRNFTTMMMATRNNCWPIQPSSGEMPQRRCRRSTAAYGMLGRREYNVQTSNTYSTKSVVTGVGEERVKSMRITHISAVTSLVLEFVTASSS